MPLGRILPKALIALLAALAVWAGVRYGPSLVEGRYRKQLWDPGVVATVNGRPITRAKVDDLLRLGFYPPLALGGGTPQGAIGLSQVLDILIEEELVLQAAEKQGIVVPEEEVARLLALLEPSWQCEDDSGRECWRPKGEELMALERAIRTQLMLASLTKGVSANEGRRVASEWEAFLAGWSRRHSMAQAYRTRVLLAERSPKARRLLASRPASGTSLDRLAAILDKGGVGHVLSDPLYMDPSGNGAAGLFPGVNLASELAKAAAAPDRLTGVLPLSESWGVVEVLETIQRPSPEEMTRAARERYESQVSARAFRAFVARQRAEAKIELNPNFPWDVGERPAPAQEAAPAQESPEPAGQESPEPVSDEAAPVQEAAPVKESPEPAGPESPEPVSDEAAPAQEAVPAQESPESAGPDSPEPISDEAAPAQGAVPAQESSEPPGPESPEPVSD
ncbi:MAG: SurA N-terminal domain-containing protein, partial [Deltaproteobacteria bacterium]|nr:SurA N-terminal domain-containing protein [Deltaproteobacteria bacterium]